MYCSNAMKISHLEMIGTYTGCIYYSHKIKEICKGTIIPLDLQLRYPVVCAVVVNQVIFP